MSSRQMTQPEVIEAKSRNVVFTVTKDTLIDRDWNRRQQ